MADKKIASGGSGSPQAGPGAGITKLEAVRRALTKLGNTTTPTIIQGYVKKHYGIEMSKDHISNAKGQVLGRRAARKPAPAQPAVAQPAAPKVKAKKSAPGPQGMSVAAAPPASSKSISGKDIETVEELVRRVGADLLRKVIDLVAKK